MDDAGNCASYFELFAEYRDEPILFPYDIEDDHIIGKKFDNVQFNTEKRVRAYAEYNNVLSGGVYEGKDIDGKRQSCDFNVTKLLQENP